MSQFWQVYRHYLSSNMYRCRWNAAQTATALKDRMLHHSSCRGSPYLGGWTAPISTTYNLLKSQVSYQMTVLVRPLRYSASPVKAKSIGKLDPQADTFYRWCTASQILATVRPKYCAPLDIVLLLLYTSCRLWQLDPTSMKRFTPDKHSVLYKYPKKCLAWVRILYPVDIW